MSTNLIIGRQKRFESPKIQKLYDKFTSPEEITTIAEEIVDKPQIRMTVQNAIFFGKTEQLKELQTGFLAEYKKQGIAPLDFIELV